MKITHHVLRVLIVYIFIALIGSLLVGIFFGGTDDFVGGNSFLYKITSGLLIFANILPAVLISGILVGYSWAFGRYSNENPGRFSSLLLSYIKSVFIVGLICTLLCLSSTEILKTYILRKQADIRQREEDYTEYVSLAKKYNSEENYSAAKFYAEYALKLKKGDEKLQVLYDQINVNDSLEKVTPIITKQAEEPKKIVIKPEYDDIPGLMQRAEQALTNKHYFDAHFYATLVVDSTEDKDVNKIKARGLAAEAWNKLEQTDYNIEDVPQRVFAEKKRGYKALMQGENAKAYYIYRRLYETYPTDVDIEKYFEIAKEKIEEQFFYIDETVDLQPFEQYHNVYFAHNRVDGGKDVVYIKGITVMDKAGDMLLYLRGFNVFSYDETEKLQRSFTVPYAKVSAVPATDFGKTFIDKFNITEKDCLPYVMLESIDRDNEGVKIEPKYTYSEEDLLAGIDKNIQEQSFMVFAMPYNDFILVCKASLGAEKMPLGSLFLFLDKAKDFGYAFEIYAQHFIQRTCFPLVLMILMLFAAILGWNYRIQFEAVFKFKWLFSVPIFTIVAYLILNFIQYLQSLLNYALLGVMGFAAFPVILAVYAVLLIVVSVMFVALRGE